MNNDKFNRIIALSKKNFTLYIKKGPVLIFGLLFPFFMVVSWILGRDLTLEQIFIGIVGMTSFFTATAVSPVILPIETREKSLERILAAPISLIEILLGIIFASTIYSITITTIISLIFIIISPTLIITGLGYFYLFIGIFLMGLLGSLLGLLVSAKPTDQTSDVMVLSNLIKFPLLFLGGVFIPLKNLSSIGSILNLISPLTYFTEILRNIVGENSVITTGMNILILCLWIILLFLLNYMIHKKTMTKRLSETGNKKKTMKNRQKKI